MSIFSDHFLDANGEEFVFEDIIAELDFYGEAAAKEFDDWTSLSLQPLADYGETQSSFLSSSFRTHAFVKSAQN